MSTPAETYERLHDGLSDMIESGRLTEADIPDDYEWLVGLLAYAAALQDTETQKKGLKNGR